MVWGLRAKCFSGFGFLGFLPLRPLSGLDGRAEEAYHLSWLEVVFPLHDAGQYPSCLLGVFTSGEYGSYEA